MDLHPKQLHGLILFASGVVPLYMDRMVPVVTPHHFAEGRTIHYATIGLCASRAYLHRGTNKCHEDPYRLQQPLTILPLHLSTRLPDLHSCHLFHQLSSDAYNVPTPVLINRTKV